MSLLRVEAVTKRRGGQDVLRGAALDVPAGAIVALLGPSGCGKTTLLRLIAGFEHADSGRIMLADRTLQDGDAFVPAEKRRIGYVPQEGTLFPHLTVAGNVGFGLTRRERRGPIIGDALALTGLAGFERRYPHQLSGGQQQRTALARALAPRPDLVLLDEPFAGLDLDLRRAVCADVVALLRASAATALLVTHDPQEAFAHADRVAVMQAGQIAQCDTPAIVYRRPATPEIARLTGMTVLLPGRSDGVIADTALGHLPLYPGAPAGEVQILLRPDQIVSSSGDGVAAAVLETAFRGDHTVVTMRLGETTLALPMRLPEMQDIVRIRIEGRCAAYAV